MKNTKQKRLNPVEEGAVKMLSSGQPTILINTSKAEMTSRDIMEKWKQELPSLKPVDLLPLVHSRCTSWPIVKQTRKPKGDTYVLLDPRGIYGGPNMGRLASILPLIKNSTYEECKNNGKKFEHEPLGYLQGIRDDEFDRIALSRWGSRFGDYRDLEHFVVPALPIEPTGTLRSRDHEGKRQMNGETAKNLENLFNELQQNQSVDKSFLDYPFRRFVEQSIQGMERVESVLWLARYKIRTNDYWRPHYRPMTGAEYHSPQYYSTLFAFPKGEEGIAVDFSDGLFVPPKLMSKNLVSPQENLSEKRDSYRRRPSCSSSVAISSPPTYLIDEIEIVRLGEIKCARAMLVGDSNPLTNVENCNPNYNFSYSPITVLCDSFLKPSEK